jgi:hypothetical protein
MTTDAPKKRKRKSPVLGYKQRYLLSQDGVTVYEQNEIEALRLEFNLPETVSTEEFKRRLEGAAQVYRIYKQNYDDLPRHGEIKAALEEIASLSKTLHKHITEIDDITANHFWQFEGELQNSVTFTEDTETRFGHRIERDVIGDTTVLSYLSQRDYIDSLTILHNYATEALAKLPDDPGGRRASQGLRMWMTNIAAIWKELFKRKFSRDSEKGRAANEATSFAVKAFKSIDPKVPESTIINEVRKYITHHPNKPTGKN